MTTRRRMERPRDSRKGPIGHQPQSQLDGRPSCRSRRRPARCGGAGAAVSPFQQPARLPSLLMLLVALLIIVVGRVGVDAFAPLSPPLLSMGGAACRGGSALGAWGRGRAERGLLAMKKDDDGGKKPIKRVCATNKYVCCTGCGCWWVGVGLCLDMVIDLCPGFLWCGGFATAGKSHGMPWLTYESNYPHEPKSTKIGTPSPRTRSGRSSRRASRSWGRKS